MRRWHCGELSDQPTLATTDQMGEVTWAFSGPSGTQGKVHCETRWTCVDFITARDAAVAGLGVALLPDHICRTELARGAWSMSSPAGMPRTELSTSFHTASRSIARRSRLHRSSGGGIPAWKDRKLKRPLRSDRDGWEKECPCVDAARLSRPSHAAGL
jgi:DNA-binding transcriptional LysR family regulator